MELTIKHQKITIMKTTWLIRRNTLLTIGLLFFGIYSSTAQDNAPGIIIQTAKLNCSVKKAFAFFTENQHLEKWLTVKAHVEPEVWGKYELFWEPERPEVNSTIGCKVLAIEKNKHINVEWKGPEQFSHFMNNIQPLTNVTIVFTPHKGYTTATLMHTGWKSSAEWQEAREFFVDAWKEAFQKLEKYANEK